MSAFTDIADRFEELRFPDPDEYVLEMQHDRERFAESWGKAAAAYDSLSREIAKRVGTEKAQRTALLRRLQRHTENSRSFAEDTQRLWERTEHWREDGCLNLIEIVWTFLGGTTHKERWAAAESRALAAASKQGERVFRRLVRERELLQIELDAARQPTA